MNRTTKLATLAGALLLAIGAATQAHPGREPDYAKLQAELKLSNQQLEALKTERARHEQAMDVFHEDTRARAKLLMEEHRDRLGKFLSKEQMDQLKEKFHDRRKARHERMHDLHDEG